MEKCSWNQQQTMLLQQVATNCKNNTKTMLHELYNKHGIKRTAKQVINKLYALSKPKKQKHTWTPEETEQLLHALETHGNQWKQSYPVFAHLSTSQVYHKARALLLFGNPFNYMVQIGRTFMNVFPKETQSMFLKWRYDCWRKKSGIN